MITQASGAPVESSAGILGFAACAGTQLLCYRHQSSLFQVGVLACLQGSESRRELEPSTELSAKHCKRRIATLLLE